LRLSIYKQSLRTAIIPDCVLAFTSEACVPQSSLIASWHLQAKLAYRNHPWLRLDFTSEANTP